MIRSFALVSVRRGDTKAFTTAAQFVCTQCSATRDEVQRGGALSPEMIEKRARRAGWYVESGRPSSVRCPDCTPAAPARPQKKKDLPPMADPRSLTNDQRVLIRSLLDTHFDDKRGEYLDGYSDEKIAQEAACPRVHVHNIREAAYGPVLVTAELVAARAAVAETAAAFEAFKADVERLIAQMQARLDGAAAAVAALDRR